MRYAGQTTVQCLRLHVRSSFDESAFSATTVQLEYQVSQQVLDRKLAENR